LRDKGAIHSIDDRTARYLPDVPKEDYLRAEGQNFLNRVFDGSAKNFVAALYQSGQLSDDDIAELRDYFNGGVSDD
jgi:predicted transcriptional regulator